jgi:hypothetical protein
LPTGTETWAGKVFKRFGEHMDKGCSQDNSGTDYKYVFSDSSFFFIIVFLNLQNFPLVSNQSRMLPLLKGDILCAIIGR